MSFLRDILRSKRSEIPALRKQTPNPDRAPKPKDLRRSLLEGPGSIALIAEIKLASPSEGPIRPDLDVVETARAYQAAGASAISVLTEKVYFKGSMDILEQVRRVVSVPVICKDFLIDPIQIDQARAAGADACLLIVAALPGADLAAMIRHVRALEMEALVEVHDEDELARALEADATVIGINSRDLRTFEVDLKTAERLLPQVPLGSVRVAESGMKGPMDVTRMHNAGAHAALVGTALVRAVSPGEELRRWLAACG